MADDVWSPLAACMALLSATAAAALLCVVAVLVLPARTSAPVRGEAQPSAIASAGIPPEFLKLYRSAAATYGIPWSILAGIGKVECDNGEDSAPSCWRQGAVNSAGAGGPMQFLASTWSEYGVDADGDGRKNRWDPADAIFAAANLLKSAGAPQDDRRAIYSYNHAWWYVREVLAWARRYAQMPIGAPGEAQDVSVKPALLQSQTRTPVRFIEGSRARLAPGDGHVALIPLGAPLTVQAMLVAGNELQDLPYGPQGHPDPLGAVAEDCSSTVNFVLYRAGVRTLGEILRGNPLAQNYVMWGRPGRGRWVTIYAADTPTPHVFMTIAGLRLDTSRGGTDVGPNRFEDGPRWRIFGTLPTWAHWSVRHPAGL